MRRALLAWYDLERRSLPWREGPSDYRTVVSEFMLQQTQVATVIPYFEKFVRAFPDFCALSRASEEEVLAAWSGLGYYRRARALKRAAEKIVRDHGGRLPREAETLRLLPGFGEYTTAATGSIALGLPLAAVDGNVRRVTARLFAIAADREGRDVPSRAARLLDPERPGDWNQAMMELGATVCTPREPRCLLCPLRGDCRARRLGDVESYPRKRKLPSVRRVEAVAVAVVRRGAVLLLQRGEGERFAGMWELPTMDSREVDVAELEPEEVLLRLTRLRAHGFTLLGAGRATFTHHRIETRLFRAEGVTPGAVRRQRHVALRWVRPGKLHLLAASKAQRRLFALLTSGMDEVPNDDADARR